jgi:hypothetical protein
LSKETGETAGDKNKSNQLELKKPTEKAEKTKEAKESSNEETTETVAKTATSSSLEITSEIKEGPEASSSEEGEEMTEEELRRQIFSIAKRVEETTDNLDVQRENTKKLEEEYSEIRKTVEEAKRQQMPTENGIKDEKKEEEQADESKEYDPDLEYGPNQEELAKAFEEEKQQNIVLSRQNSRYFLA